MSECAKATPDPVALEALNEVIEAWLEFVGPKAARGFLKVLGERLSRPPSNVVRLRRREVQATPEVRAWLLEQLPKWLVRHG